MPYMVLKFLVLKLDILCIWMAAAYQSSFSTEN